MRSLNWKILEQRRDQVIAVLIAFLTLSFSESVIAEPWAKHQANLSGHAAKIKSQEDEIHHLIELKKKTHDSSKLAEIVATLAEVHRSLKELSNEYEQERLHVRFEHPEKADTTDRKYVHYELRSLDEMEKDVGLDGRLDRLKLRVLSTYPLPETRPATDKKAELPNRVPASQAPTEPDEDAPEPIHLVK